jgi:hypothetical protein
MSELLSQGLTLAVPPSEAQQTQTSAHQGRSFLALASSRAYTYFCCCSICASFLWFSRIAIVLAGILREEIWQQHHFSFTMCMSDSGGRLRIVAAMRQPAAATVDERGAPWENSKILDKRSPEILKRSIWLIRVLRSRILRTGHDSKF